MTPPTRWWWVRHAPVSGYPNQLYGQLDVPCDTSNLTAMQALSAVLPADGVWLVTPLSRTQDTFRAIAEAATEALPETLSEAALIEQNFGDWQGLSWNEMQSASPTAYDRFWQDPTGQAPPGGESFAGLVHRVHQAVDRLTRRHGGRNIVAIAHGGTIRAAVAQALALDAATAMAITVDPLSLTRLTYLPDGLLQGRGGVWRVDSVNERCDWIP
jgi:alpha-ribazole phosphatase